MINEPNEEQTEITYELVEAKNDEIAIRSWQMLALRMHAAKMPFLGVEHLVRAFEHGVHKHGAGDWARYEQGNQGVLRDKATRHFAEVVRSGFAAVDAESNVLHAAKEAANMLIGAHIWGQK